MQAIITKYLCPTNYRGSRIKASAEAGSITLQWDDALNQSENHHAAALALMNKMGWGIRSTLKWRLVSGALPSVLASDAEGNGLPTVPALVSGDGGGPGNEFDVTVSGTTLRYVTKEHVAPTHLLVVAESTAVQAWLRVRATGAGTELRLLDQGTP